MIELRAVCIRVDHMTGSRDHDIIASRFNQLMPKLTRLMASPLTHLI